MKYMIIIDIFGYKFHTYCFTFMVTIYEIKAYLALLLEAHIITRTECRTMYEELRLGIIEMDRNKRESITTKYVEVSRVR